MPPSLHTHTTPTPLTPTSYGLTLSHDLTIGSVPHGGYATACIQRAVSLHFRTHPALAPRRQTDCLALQLQFARRTSVGPATVHVRHVKLGAGTSTVLAVLTQAASQDSGSSDTSTLAAAAATPLLGADDGTDLASLFPGQRICILGLLTHANLSAERGLSLPDLCWRLDPPPPPRPDFALLAADRDAAWQPADLPYTAKFRRAQTASEMYLLRGSKPWGYGGRERKGVLDQWMRLANGERWTGDSLGFLADSFPQMIEVLMGGERVDKGMDYDATRPREAKFWYPTLSMTLDVKRSLGEEGEEWLYSRIQVKQVKNGRYDLEVVIMDVEGRVVALSHHVCMIVSVERNLAPRGKGEKAKEKL